MDTAFCSNYDAFFHGIMNGGLDDTFMVRLSFSEDVRARPSLLVWDTPFSSQ